jgi:glycine cleavage system H protein
MSEWRTVSLKQELIEEIEEEIKTGRYRSISEFVSEAIRLRLEDLMRAEGISTEKRKELLQTPELLLYTPKHTWAQVTPEGNIRVGVSDYAQSHLKGIAHIMTDAVGKDVSKMEPFGVAETWMFMFDLYAPVSGRILRVNGKLKDDPQAVSKDPYNEGWIVEIKPKNSLTLEDELKSLLGAREYSKLVAKLEGRIQG